MSVDLDSRHGKRKAAGTETVDESVQRLAAENATGGHTTIDVAELPMERVASKHSFFFGFWPTVRDIYRHRELLGQLVKKELKIKYKDSVLGFFWTLLRPLMYLLIYSVAIGVFLGSNRAVPEFGVYLFSGLLAWNLFTDIIGGCTGTIITNAGLIKKIYFPRELFPLSVVGAALVNFMLQLVVLIGAYVVTWTPPHWGLDLLLIPMGLLVLVLLSLGLGLILGSANVFLRDVEYLVDVGLLLAFWMTPIVYDWTKVRVQAVCKGGVTKVVTNSTGTHYYPTVCQVTDNHLAWLFQIYMANPMANVVLGFQRAMWPAGHTSKGQVFFYNGDLFLRLGVLAVICVALVWVGQRIFARAQGNFAQEL